MQYTLILTSQEIEVISRMLQEWPYKYVRPILDNIWKQVDVQNQSKEDLTPKQD